jgi:hypothetical protein
MTKAAVSVGDQVYTKEGGEEFGAVRYVLPNELVIAIEGAGDFTIAAEVVRAVHDGKVIIDATAVSSEVQAAIAKAHSQEEAGK